ncbi:MAG: PQQ-binding-like beta-propeller repeat protein, partial [Rhodospirillaceae bacterium]|nr:PQQ-binding-like beta-propeller repeat protein [Rhodospirillaceae bacterium]
MTRIAAFLGVVFLLGGCSGWLGSDESKPLPGKRISVMSLGNTLEADPRLSDLAVRLPRPFANSEWAQAGGVPNHAMHHLSAKGGLEEAWTADIGDGSSGEAQLISSPVVAGDHVYTMDVEGTIRAFDVKSGRRIWSITLAAKNKEDEDDMSGGGIAYANGRLIATTGFAEIIAVNASDGSEIWRRNLSGPMRAAPTVFKGRVFAVTIANELYALDVRDGRELWSHVGITESAGLLGGASPTADGSVVIASYSSGEIVALRTENGRVVWSDTLSALRRSDPVSTLAHIKGHPVIDRNRVIAVANSGRTVSIDLRTGTRLWERPIGSAFGPWVAGEFIFVLSNSGELVCLARRNGGVRWVRQLQRFEDE